MEDETTISQGDDLAAAPVELSPMSEEAGDRAIESLLSGSPLPKGDKAAEGEAPASEVNPEEGDDELDLVIDQEDDEPDSSQAPAQPEIKDDLMITLEDGQQISLGDLKRNNLFQRDYTFKSEKLKQEETRLKQENETWRKTEEDRIRQSRQAILDYASRHLPQPPSNTMLIEGHADFDPVTHMIQDAAYKAQMNELSAVWEQEQREQQQQSEKQTAEAQEAFKKQHEDLRVRLPKLKDAVKLKAFSDDISRILPSVYRVNPAEVEQIKDAGYMHILHDAIEYRKLVEKSKTVQKTLVSAPKLEGKQRSTPMTEQSRDMQGRFESLRKTGSVEAGDRALEAFLSRR